MELVILRSSMEMIKANDIGTYCLKFYDQLTQSEAIVDPFAENLARLEAAGIRTLPDVLAAPKWVWSCLSIPIGLKNFLMDAARKQKGTRQLTVVPGFNVWDNDLGDFRDTGAFIGKDFRLDKFQPWEKDEDDHYRIYYFLTPEAEKIRDKLEWAMREWEHALNHIDKKKSLSRIIEFVDATKTFKDSFKAKKLPKPGRSKKDYLQARKNFRKCDKECKEKTMERKKMWKELGEKFPVELLSKDREYKKYNPNFCKSGSWDDWGNHYKSKEVTGVMRRIQKQKKTTSKEAFIQELVATFKGPTMTEFEAKYKLFADKKKEEGAKRKVLEKLKTIKEEARAAQFDYEYINTGHEDKQVLLIHYTDIDTTPLEVSKAAPSARDKLGVKTKNKSVNDEDKDEGSDDELYGLKDVAKLGAKKFVVDEAEVKSWENFLTHKLMSNSSLLDARDTIDELIKLEAGAKAAGLKLVGLSAEPKNKIDKFKQKCIDILVNQFGNSSAKQVVDSVAQLLKEHGIKPKEDLGIADFDELQDLLKKNKMASSGGSGLGLAGPQPSSAPKNDGNLVSETTGETTPLGRWASPKVYWIKNPYLESNYVYGIMKVMKVFIEAMNETSPLDQPRVFQADDFVRAHCRMVVGECNGPEEIVNTIVHELGHVLGLEEEFLCANATALFEEADLNDRWHDDTRKPYEISEWFDLGSIMLYETDVTRLNEKGLIALWNTKDGKKIIDSIAKTHLPSLWDAKFLHSLYFPEVTYDDIEVPPSARSDKFLSAYDKANGNKRNGEEMRVQKIDKMFDQVRQTFEPVEQQIKKFLEVLLEAVKEDTRACGVYLQTLEEGAYEVRKAFDDAGQLIEKQTEWAKKHSVTVRESTTLLALFMARMAVFILQSHELIASRQELACFQGFIPEHKQQKK